MRSSLHNPVCCVIIISGKFGWSMHFANLCPLRTQRLNSYQICCKDLSCCVRIFLACILSYKENCVMVQAEI